MLKQNYEELKKRKKILSAVDVLGSFDFLTYTISLDSLNLNDIKILLDVKNISQSEINYKYRKVFCLAVHEYTHFVDASSTIWGINHLYLMNEAYLSSDSYKRDPEQFYKAKEFHTHIRKIKYPKYYNFIGKVENPFPWGANPTMGLLFGADGKLTDEGIVFMRFYTISGEEIARTPISAVSILEASAMANEIFSKVSFVNMLNAKEDLILANKDLHDEVMSFLYHKELTEYSACVHILANQQQCKDVLQAFYLVSLLTRIVLNTAESVFNKILELNIFKETFQIKDEESTHYIRIKQGLIYKNMGMLYYLLVSGLPENSYLTPDLAIKGVSISLSKLGLDIDLIKKSALKEFNKKCDEIETTQITPLKKLSIIARKNFNMIDIQKISLPFDKLHLPRVILNDFDEDDNIAEALMFPNEDNLLKDFNIDESYSELAKGVEWVYRFSESCV